MSRRLSAPQSVVVTRIASVWAQAVRIWKSEAAARSFSPDSIRSWAIASRLIWYWRTKSAQVLYGMYWDGSRVDQLSNGSDA